MAASATLQSDGFGVLLVRGFVLVRHIGRNLKIALVLGVVCIGLDCSVESPMSLKRVFPAMMLLEFATTYRNTKSQGFRDDS